MTSVLWRPRGQPPFSRERLSGSYAPRGTSKRKRRRRINLSFPAMPNPYLPIVPAEGRSFTKYSLSENSSSAFLYYSVQSALSFFFFLNGCFLSRQCSGGRYFRRPFIPLRPPASCTRPPRLLPRSVFLSLSLPFSRSLVRQTGFVQLGCCQMTDRPTATKRRHSHISAHRSGPLLHTHTRCTTHAQAYEAAHF